MPHVAWLRHNMCTTGGTHLEVPCAPSHSRNNQQVPERPSRVAFEVARIRKSEKDLVVITAAAAAAGSELRPARQGVSGHGREASIF